MIGEAGAAEELTRRITALEGVRGIFPHSVTAAVLAAVTSDRGSTGLVLLDREEGVVRVTARLATSRGTPAPQVAVRVAGAVAEFAGDEPVLLRIEFAHID